MALSSYSPRNAVEEDSTVTTEENQKKPKANNKDVRVTSFKVIMENIQNDSGWRCVSTAYVYAIVKGKPVQFVAEGTNQVEALMRVLEKVTPLPKEFETRGVSGISESILCGLVDNFLSESGR